MLQLMLAPLAVARAGRIVKKAHTLIAQWLALLSNTLLSRAKSAEILCGLWDNCIQSASTVFCRTRCGVIYHR